MTYITKFRDRAEAGLLLAKKLRKYANRKDVADFGVAARWSAGGV
jgi:predicted phosphoribosyltransferase